MRKKIAMALFVLPPVALFGVVLYVAAERYSGAGVVVVLAVLTALVGWYGITATIYGKE